MDELISIIVPVYNVSVYVEKCVRSLMLQTYHNIEIIIVNDGSTDNSLEIVRNIEKEDERIIVIDKPNGGISSARNAGLDIAKGRYILFIDSDDTINENAVSLLYNKLIEQNADIAVMRVAQVYGDGHTEEFYFSDNEYDIIDLNDNNWFFKDASVFHPAWNKLYKRELIKFKFDENLKRNEDIEFNGKIYCHANKIVVVNKPMYFQLQRSSSLCHTGRKTAEEIELIKKVYDEVIEYGSEVQLTEVRKKELMKYLHFRIDILLQMIIYDESGYKNRKMYMKQLREYFPGWKYTLVNDIKSSNVNKRFLLFKKLYDMRLYYFLYHFKDIANLTRLIRRQKIVKSQEENMFK